MWSDRNKRWFFGTLIVALMLAFISRAQTNNIIQPLKANRLIGMKVENNDGQNLGKLRDFVVDIQSGEVKFVLLASGGFWGIGSKLKAVPPQLLSAATSKRNTLEAKIVKDRWEKAPIIRTSQLRMLATPERANAVYAFYEQGQTSKALASNTNSNSPTLATTGRATNRQTQATGEVLKTASELIAGDVVNRQQEKIGEIRDLLIGFDTAQPAFAIVTAGKLSRGQSNDYAIPLALLTPTETSDRWMVDATPARLESAPVLDQKIWQRAHSGNTSEIYHYREVPAKPQTQ